MQKVWPFPYPYMVTCAAASSYNLSVYVRTEEKTYERLLDKTMKLLKTKIDKRKHPDFSDYLNNL